MKKKKIVTVGGGTGSFTVLTGIREYPFEISAVVAMTDDGGSTGVLRDEIGVLPPGDVRQCLVALSESSEMMRQLMNYRFGKGKLKGHNFGNLFLSALEKIKGSFAGGIEEASKILNVKGDILPVVNQDLRLVADCGKGKKIVGEDSINRSKLSKNCKIGFSSRAIANKRAIKKVLQADIVVIGPGNHYCSVLPNIAVKGFAKAIRNTKAKVVYICNLTNKRGHTNGWTLDDYVDSVEKYIGRGRIDHVIFPSRKPNRRLIERYEKQEGFDVMVKFDLRNCDKRDFELVLRNIVSNKQVKYNKADAVAPLRSFIRHDSDRLAKAIYEVTELIS
jgi:uncharacterized cofD-like protein